MTNAAHPRDPVKVLLLCRFGPMAAATRVRFLQYLPVLEAHGVEVDVSPLLGDDVLRDLYVGGSRPLPAYARGYGRRAGEVLRLLASRRYDVVWSYFELFPGLPATAERLLRARGVPMVVDYDDAAFHTYDQHPRPVVRHVLGGKIDAVMRQATVVVAGNDYLADHARAAGARTVELIPTVVDLAQYHAPDRARAARGAGLFTVGWIGSPPTAKHLGEAWEGVRQFLAARPGARVVLVGLDRVPEAAPPGIEVRPWRHGCEGEELAGFDVGIMPLPDEPFERGKCGYKLIQYFAAGLPAVASPVGVNATLVREGVNGFLATTPEAWAAALTRLHDDAELRSRLGRAGRVDVEEHYSLERAAPRVVDVLHGAAQTGRRQRADRRRHEPGGARP